MNLYLDDDIAKVALAARLRRAGHQVVLPTDAGISGASDPRHLLFAVQQNLVLITKNHDDYEDLHFWSRARTVNTRAFLRFAPTTILPAT